MFPASIERTADPLQMHYACLCAEQVCQVYEPDASLAPEVVDKYTPPALVAYVYPSLDAGPAAEDVEEVRVAVRWGLSYMPTYCLSYYIRCISQAGCVHAGCVCSYAVTWQDMPLWCGQIGAVKSSNVDQRWTTF